METSILTKNQKQVFTKNIIWEGKPSIITCTIRYDDECNNGHNTFVITGSFSSLLSVPIPPVVLHRFPSIVHGLPFDSIAAA